MIDMGQADRSLRMRPRSEVPRMAWTLALTRAAKRMGFDSYMDVPCGTPKDEELRLLAHQIRIEQA